MPRWENKSELERFEEKYIPVTESGCWVWIGAGQDRYGSFYMPSYPIPMSNSTVSAHKAALYLYKGIVPEEGMVVLHKCDNGFCCNPEHLMVDTQYENMQDMTRKKRYKPRQKISADDVKEAIKLREQGMLVKDIANLYNLSESQMSRVVRGLTHK